MRGVRGAVAALAALLLVAAPARADSNADEAEARFRRGTEHLKVKRYSDALLEFFASYRLARNRNVVYNIAGCYEAMSLFDEAYRYYDEYLVDEKDPAERAAVEKKLAELQPRVALVTIETTPPGATVYVDREDLGGRGETRPRGTEPLKLAVAPGEHTVILKREGYHTASAPVTTARGQVAAVDVELRRVVGMIIVSSSPSAAVWIDRSPSDAAPDSPDTPVSFDLSPGPHDLVLTAAGHEPLALRVVVEAGAKANVGGVLTPIPQPQGSLAVSANVGGAQVLIDGKLAGFCPAVLSVAVGDHEVEVTRPGYDPWRARVTVVDKGSQFLTAKLRRSEALVVGASRQAEKVSEAPASVTLLGREELRAFGYETLADAARVVRGLYSTYDRNYTALGFRGFSRPSDYTNRVLVTRDGHTLNDDWAGSAGIGRDFAVDLEDVERVEVVRGPGSAFYGPGAFFGVVNVVSVAPGAAPRLAAGSGLGSNGLSRMWVSGAGRAGGAELSATVSGSSSTGQSLYFPAVDAVVRDADDESALRAAGHLRAGELSLDLGVNRRVKDVPTATYGTLVDPAYNPLGSGVVTRTADTRGFIEGRFERSADPVALSARLSLDFARYRGRWPYPAGLVIEDGGHGYWGGAEVRVRLHAPAWSRLTLGVEGAYHFTGQSSEANDGSADWTDARRFGTLSVYAVEEIRLGRRVRLSAGARGDYSALAGLTQSLAVSPRLAAILRPYDHGTTKVVVGQAYRAPSTYELYYTDRVSQEPALQLDGERIITAEVEHTHDLGRGAYLVGSLFGSQLSGLIDLVTNETTGLLTYRNSAQAVVAAGVELEARFVFGERGWISAAVSTSHFAEGWGKLLEATPAELVPNSPAVVGALRGYWPLVAGDDDPGTRGEALALAAEVLFNSKRAFRDGSAQTGEMLLGNVALSGRLASSPLRWRLAVNNLLDWRYSVPVGAEFDRILSLTQDGRSFLATVSYER